MRKNSALGVMSGVSPLISRSVTDASDRVCAGSVLAGDGSVAPGAAPSPVVLFAPPEVRALVPTAATAAPAAAMPVHRRNERRVPTTRLLDRGDESDGPSGCCSSIHVVNPLKGALRWSGGERHGPLPARPPTDRSVGCGLPLEHPQFDPVSDRRVRFGWLVLPVTCVHKANGAGL